MGLEMACAAQEAQEDFKGRCATPVLKYVERVEAESDDESDVEGDDVVLLHQRSCFGVSPAPSDSIASSAQSNWTPGCESEAAPACFQEELSNQGFMLNAPRPTPPVTDYLAPVIADVLANVSARCHNTAAQDSTFMSKYPMMHLTDYVLRVSQCSGLTVAPYVAALILIHRLSESHPELITPYTIHKLFLTALSIGHKAVEEYQLMNSTTACIGGITAAELKECEFELVQLLDWEIGINEAKLTGYLQTLTNRAHLPIEAVGNIGFLGY
eukprot:TRINITY_DN9185_c0_g1_i1.p2 TRINITY_DN9185_c0_g1~~TRINITY_DN9185_c0_g1_i1.p2  ORF type:complete len:270 (+),score=119.17 TRINITY_DN9185_c0_g1_i1:74-883(+)